MQNHRLSVLVKIPQTAGSKTLQGLYPRGLITGVKKTVSITMVETSYCCTC